MEPIVKLIKPEDATGKTKDLYDAMIAKSGSVPKWMQVMASNEDVLIGFFTLFKCTMDDAPADQTLKWKIAYRVSQINNCQFCIGVAEHQLESLGIPAEELEKLSENLTEKEQIAMDYAEAVTSHANKIEPETIEKLKNTFTDEEIVEITAAVGLFSYINRFNDALKILPN